MTDLITRKPSDWDIKNLEDIATFITKGATPTTYGFEWVEESSENIPFLRSECVTANGFNRKGMNFISQKAHVTMGRSKIKSGDILMTITGNIGRIATLPDEILEANINQHIAKISVIDGVSSFYVAQALQQEFYNRYYERILTGQAYPQISLKQVRETPILLPPYLEQQKIAEVLSTVDKKIDLIDQKIAETEKLKTGLMQKLFSEGVGVQDDNGNWQPHTEFQDSPFGKIPRAWKYAPVKSLVSIKSPKYDPKIKTESLPCIELEHLSQGSGEILGTVNSLELASTKNCFAKGDVLFGKLRPYLKKFAKPNFNGVCSSEIWVMKATDNKVLHNDFWFYFIQSERFINEANKSCGTKMPRADWKVVSELILPIPSFYEQLGIAKILECVDAKLGLLKQQKAETQQLKKGLMQKLLTGEWRVPVEETEAA
ncbi:restriction endonuclease subunit S [Vibrio cincinnatiensis]